MFYLLLIPFILLGPLMVVDEFYYHHKRGLPLWERLGHPFDSLTVLICALFALFMPFSETNVYYFAVLMILSSLSVTKDEWVHHEHCPPTEQWLHSVLFLLHPMFILSMVGFWYLKESEARAMIMLQMQSISIFLFTIYQVVYWNFIRKN